MTPWILRPLGTLALAVALTGCATIIQGSTQQVSVSSTPTAARVLVDGQPMGQTPVTLHLKRKDSHTLRLELGGYEPYELALSRSTSGWVMGNILFGGLIGLAVDAGTGAMYRLAPDQVSAEMRAAQTTASSRNGEVFVAVVLRPEAGWERVGQLTPAP